MSTENELVEDQQDDYLPADDDIEVVIESDEPEVEAEADTEESEGVDAAEAAPEGEDTDEAAAAPEVQEADPELESMPVKFRKRLEREQRLRNTIIGEREQIKAAAIQAVQIAKQRDEEVQALRTQNAALQRQFADSLEYAYERDITLKAAEVRKAREDGNYDAELRAQGDLDALRFQQNQVRQAKMSLGNTPAPQQAAPQPMQQQMPQQPQQQQRPAPAPLALKWVQKNRAWLDNPSFAGQRAFAIAEDSKLVAEGYDKNSPDYYAELDRRVDTAFPTLRKRAPSRGGSPVAPATSVAAKKAGKQITLTRADLANMQRFGLDINNKEHLREFARSKRAST